MPLSSLLTLSDISVSQFEGILSLAVRCKEDPILTPVLSGKTAVLLFQKPSTRTRLAFETAMQEAGGGTIFLSDDIHNETFHDTARVMGRMTDLIVFRGFSQTMLQELHSFSGIPVINALTDYLHPTQALADIMTIKEQLSIPQPCIAFVGNGFNNITHSLILASSMAGMHLRIACPPELAPSKDILQKARFFSQQSNSSCAVTESVKEAVTGAQIVYTDKWISMGDADTQQTRKKLLAPYRVSAAVLEYGDKAKFMHCLPALRGEEVDASVIDGPHSIVWQQAENRKHVAAALLRLMLLH